MNLGINNTSFKGHIKFKDLNGNKQNIDTKDIKEIGVAHKDYLYIKTQHDRGFDASDGFERYTKEECIEIPSENIQKDYDRFMRIYDIASRNNITIKYLNEKNPLDEQLDILG